MRRVSLLAAILLSVVWGTYAQSLKPENPYPLKAGINRGTADSLIGTQYWFFYAHPGSNHVNIRFKPMGLYGAPIGNNSLTITLSDEARTWHVTKVIASSSKVAETSFTADKVEKRQKIVIAVAPPNQNLIRMGGDYEIEAAGDVEFAGSSATTDPVVRTYQPMFSEATGDYGTVRFNADGTVDTANGFHGTWELFDRENRIYVVNILKYRYSVQYLPGYGLVKPSDPSSIQFQELRR